MKFKNIKMTYPLYENHTGYHLAPDYPELNQTQSQGLRQLIMDMLTQKSVFHFKYLINLMK